MHSYLRSTSQIMVCQTCVRRFTKTHADRLMDSDCTVLRTDTNKSCVYLHLPCTPICQYIRLNVNCFSWTSLSHLAADFTFYTSLTNICTKPLLSFGKVLGKFFWSVFLTYDRKPQTQFSDGRRANNALLCPATNSPIFKLAGFVKFVRYSSPQICQTVKGFFSIW